MKLLTAITNMSKVVEVKLESGDDVKKEQTYLLGGNEVVTVTEIIARRGDIAGLRIERGEPAIHQPAGAKFQAV